MTLQTSQRSARPFVLVWLGYSLLLILGVRFLLFPSGLTERMDFRVLYTGGLLLRTDPSMLYDLGRWGTEVLPFNHPPLEAVAFAPLSRLPYRDAYLVFCVLNLTILLVCFFLCRNVFSIPGGIAQPKPGLQLLAFFPTVFALLQGQDSILLFLVVCGACRFAAGQKTLYSGLVLGLALFKPQIIIPMAAMLAIIYGWRFLAGFLASAAVVLTGSALLVGPTAFRNFLGLLLRTGSVSLRSDLPVGTIGVTPSIMPNIRGIVSLLAAHWLPGSLVFLITIVISLFVLVVGIRILIRQREPEAAFALAVTCAVLLSYHLMIYDLLVLQIPFALVAGVANRLTSYARTALYLAPPIVVMLVPGSLALLALPVLLLSYGLAQIVRSEGRTAAFVGNANAALSAECKEGV